MWKQAVIALFALLLVASVVSLPDPIGFGVLDRIYCKTGDCASASQMSSATTNLSTLNGTVNGFPDFAKSTNANFTAIRVADSANDTDYRNKIASATANLSLANGTDTTQNSYLTTTAGNVTTLNDTLSNGRGFIHANQINGTTGNFSKIFLKTVGGSGNSALQIKSTGAGAYSSIDIFNDVNALFQFGYYANGAALPNTAFFFNNEAGGHVIFATEGSEKVRIRNDGQLQAPSGINSSTIYVGTTELSNALSSIAANFTSGNGTDTTQNSYLTAIASNVTLANSTGARLLTDLATTKSNVTTINVSLGGKLNTSQNFGALMLNGSLTIGTMHNLTIGAIFSNATHQCYDFPTNSHCTYSNASGRIDT